jgi:CheY-like chemotaxis protein
LDGHQVLIARSGRETLQLVRENQPDILLLDIMMPGIDGYEICRQIKSDPATRDTVVVMLTALPRTERFKSFQAGADEHITKPVPSRQLRETVRQLAERKKQSDSRRR